MCDGNVAGGDAFLDAGHNCFGTGAFVICLADGDVPIQPLSVDSPMTVDTSTCPLKFMPASGPQWCVLTGTTIVISNKLTARGDLPLVLLATETITVTGSGIVDVSSDNMNNLGAGANYTAGCNPNVPPGLSSGQGAGGGGGGSFGTQGGAGGTGSSGGGGAGGQGGAVVTAPVDRLRGGCAGSTGGIGDIANNGGAGGNGGGAVYLVAGNVVSIDGIVNASGGGGHHGLPGRGGGGGGGSGGMIVLAAATTTIGSGKLVANGGGGGGGAANTGTGFDAGDPDPTMPQTPAALGLGNGNNAGPGAIGAVNTNVGGTAINAGDGAGAGGGGVGVIRKLVGSQANNPNISPPATN